MENAKIANWLDDLVRFRENEYNSLCELNCFSYEDSQKYLAKTEEIRKELVEARKNANEDPKQDIEEKLKTLESQYAYLAADFKNYKNRMLRDTELSRFQIKKDFLLKLLPIIDDFERVMENICHRDLTDDCDELDTGVELVYENLMKMLDNIGAKKIECKEGMTFDVSQHEAISVQQRDGFTLDEYPSNSIFKVLQNGWMLDNTLIRPAKIITME